MTPEEAVENAIRDCSGDKWLAHRFLFGHRHPLGSAPFHRAFVDDFWSDDRYSQILAFRGSAKSTYGEEDIALAILLRAFHNILIIGASETRAAERLASVAYELETNEKAELLFGTQKGGVWTQTKIVTPSGHCVQAMGRDQDIRGIKHLEWRPDFVFVDDFEDKDNVQSPEGRAKTLRWFLAELLPACAPERRVRVRATPMDAESVPMRLWRESRWPTRIFPIEHKDGTTGARRATWESAFPLGWIDRERVIYERLGEMGVWSREYMCEAVSDADRTFEKKMIRIEPRVRDWQATYAMYDPARTTNRQSATTGKAVWSWINNRLVVWDATARLWKPDEIIADIFDTAAEYGPVWLGVEEDGLNEFILQPLRHEQARRGLAVPIRAVRAPRGKLDFIRALQPFFGAREVIFAKPLPELEAQLLSFPTGRIDAPNALAYALTLRPGAPVYDNFSDEHIDDALEPHPAHPLYLAANATQGMVAAMLVQAYDGNLHIFADWMREGDPAESVGDIHAEAALEGDSRRLVRQRAGNLGDALKNPEARLVLARTPLRWVVPQHHGERYTNIGLMQAVGRIPASCARGGKEDAGREHLRDMLARRHHGGVALAVSPRARWTLNALAGGYCRAVKKGGGLADHPEEGVYRVLMEGLEAFLGLLRVGRGQEDDDESQNWAYDRHGRRYLSAMPARR